MTNRDTASTDKIGIDGYFVARPYYYDVVDKNVQTWKNYKLLPRGKKTYLDDVIGDAKKKNYPQVYGKVQDWKELGINVGLHGHAHKFEFRKSKKETLNAEIMRLEKAKKSPAPGAYDLPKYKIPQTANNKEDQRMMVADC